jgi:hypothetical protein
LSLRGDHRFSRRDANHPQVVGWYEELFCSVVDLSAVGGGVPDLLVGCAGRSELVEVKTEDGDLEPNQLTFAKTWRGNPVVVVRTQAEVIAHVQRIRQKVAGR